MSDEDNFDKTLKEREIKRLTTPLTYTKTKWKVPHVYDCEGTEIQPDSVSGKYILEPKKGILTDDEILKYAGDSNTAAKIRLKRGTEYSSDKWQVYKENITSVEIFGWIFGTMFIAMSGMFIGFWPAMILFILMAIFLIGFPIYLLYLKDYTKKEPTSFKSIKRDKTPTIAENQDNNNLSSLNIYRTQVKDLKNLYEVKEKITKELIEKRFEPPQITYDKFISAVDSCTDLFNNQVEVISNMINLASEHTPQIDYEIETRINILKSIIEKIDSLTNELVINIGQSQSEEDEHVKDLLEDMENLIGSIKDYN